MPGEDHAGARRGGEAVITQGALDLACVKEGLAGWLGIQRPPSAVGPRLVLPQKIMAAVVPRRRQRFDLQQPDLAGWGKEHAINVSRAAWQGQVADEHIIVVQY